MASLANPTRAAGAAPRRLAGLRSLGPGAVVTAAFIGPGTVTTATLAGARYGYILLWALTFSTLATILLQEMAARLGLVTGAGLGEAIRRRFQPRAARLLAVALVISAIAFGNAAYEMGNLLGAALGAEAVRGGSLRLWAAGAAGTAFLLLWSGSYRILERALLAMVVLMAVVFLATAAMLAPSLPLLLRGLLLPSLPPGQDAVLVAIGLIGTTVVPYNLFLHAASVREKWSGPESLGMARWDLSISVAVGGVASMAIVVTAAAALPGGATVSNAAEMAVQLEPLLGRWARIFFATGLLAAGLSSAITAPLAAAYATAGAMGWPRDLRSARFRAVWLFVLLAGASFAVAGVRPVPAILFAQVANGVLLPGMALFLLLAVNDRRYIGKWANGRVLNVLGVVVVLVALLLGVRAVAGAW
ncbi:MAG: Nramp family divalent metal transporter [Gemmatimonadetes bacterium]|nr:Nramp family divalent metal transporter [Gemmatimonadota bacterium]